MFCDAFAVTFTVCCCTTSCKLGQKANLVLHRGSERWCFTTFWARELTLPRRERVSKSAPASVALASSCSGARVSDSYQPAVGWGPAALEAAQIQRHGGSEIRGVTVSGRDLDELAPSRFRGHDLVFAAGPNPLPTAAKFGSCVADLTVQQFVLESDLLSVPLPP